jgi:hypothetical protein
MKVAEMTAVEMRMTATPTTDQMVECCELLRAKGWQWQVSRYTPDDCSNPYNYGWWTLDSRPNNNADYMLGKAWTTVMNYVAPGR